MKKQLRNDLENAYRVALRFLYSDKGKRIVSACMTIFCVMLLTVTALAEGETDVAMNNIEEGVLQGTQRIYRIITSIALPITVVVFAWNLLAAIFGGEKGIDSAKKRLLYCIIILAGIWLAPVIVSQVQSWFSTAGDAGVWSNSGTSSTP